MVWSWMNAANKIQNHVRVNICQQKKKPNKFNIIYELNKL